MNILRGSEYVRQSTYDFQMIFEGVWATTPTIQCHANFNNNECLLNIPMTQITMTTVGVITAQLSDSILFPLYQVEDSIDAIDGTINSYRVPGNITITTKGLITIRPLAATFSGSNGGGWGDINISYVSQRTL